MLVFLWVEHGPRRIARVSHWFRVCSCIIFPLVVACLNNKCDACWTKFESLNMFLSLCQLKWEALKQMRFDTWLEHYGSVLLSECAEHSLSSPLIPFLHSLFPFSHTFLLLLHSVRAPHALGTLSLYFAVTDEWKWQFHQVARSFADCKNWRAGVYSKDNDVCTPDSFQTGILFAWWVKNKVCEQAFGWAAKQKKGKGTTLLGSSL